MLMFTCPSEFMATQGILCMVEASLHCGGKSCEYAKSILIPNGSCRTILYEQANIFLYRFSLQFFFNFILLAKIQHNPIAQLSLDQNEIFCQQNSLRICSIINVICKL